MGKKILSLIALFMFWITGMATPAQAQTGTTRVVLFVDQKFYGGLETEIQRLAQDIENDLSTSVLLEVVDVNETTPEAIRAILKTLHTNECLLGAIMIGDIPAISLGDFPSIPEWHEDKRKAF